MEAIAEVEFYLTSADHRQGFISGGYFAKPENVYRVKFVFDTAGDVAIGIEPVQGSPEAHQVIDQAVAEAMRYLHEHHKHDPIRSVRTHIY